VLVLLDFGAVLVAFAAALEALLPGFGAVLVAFASALVVVFLDFRVEVVVVFVVVVVGGGWMPVSPVQSYSFG
jgi:hypothetical protein